MELIPVELPAEQACASCTPVAARPALSTQDAERTAAVLKALAEPVRLRLFAQIASTPGETCVCEMLDVGVSQPTVSHHLRKLREAGLIDSERRGTWVFYRATELGRAAAEAVHSLG